MSGSTENMIPGLQSVPYVYDRKHGLLASDAWTADGANIGSNGKNLTISFLSLNRAALSIQLLRSIEQHLNDFAGEILIVDNGSEPAEVESIYDACEKSPLRCRIVELGANYGVAGGRNRAMPHVRTEWLLSLDNDIYFVRNPLRSVQRDIALLGCHFLNLPLLDRDKQTIFALGGHLYTYTNAGDLTVGGGSVYAQERALEHHSDEPFLSTFLFGGAAVVNVASFLKLGGFDDSMFIGFEDTDFSIRLFQAGYKVGNTRALALVHDHPVPKAPSDHNYERQRFASQVLKDSAGHLERKHGLTVWTHTVDHWLAEKRRELGIGEEPTQPTGICAHIPAPASRPDRPKIALLVDREGWAFWNISQQICRHLGDRYEIRVIPTDAIEHVVQSFLMVRDCDIVHVFWREYLRLLLTPHCRDYLRWLNSDYSRFRDQVLRPRIISTCIYDHLFASPSELTERAAVYRELADIYYVGSHRLHDIYACAENYPPPAMILEDGVDPSLFYPTDLDRLNTVAGRELLVGWTGNSSWGGTSEDYKGVRTILRPAIEQLRAEGLPIKLMAADRAESPAIPHERMVDYYRRIDVYVCTSLIEGTPNPVLESMACGVPIVSTDVGIVSQALGKRQSEFILAERSVECLKAALRRLVAEPSLLPVLSTENLQRAVDWHWSVKTRGFDQYFQQCLALRACGSRQLQ